MMKLYDFNVYKTTKSLFMKYRISALVHGIFAQKSWTGWWEKSAFLMGLRHMEHNLPKIFHADEQSETVLSNMIFGGYYG